MYIEVRNSETNLWSLSGRKVMMVPQHSATHSEKLCDQIPVESNHRDLVKFRDESDATYIIVRERMRRMVSDAPGVIQRRFSKSRETSENVVAKHPSLIQCNIYYGTLMLIQALDFRRSVSRKTSSGKRRGLGLYRQRAYAVLFAAYKSCTS
jgi:hypothetical protein